MSSKYPSETCRSTLYEQMLSSCAGALVASLFVTPFDVVKIRLQVQEKALPNKKCFYYYNGLWDHLCICSLDNGKPVCPWYRRPSHFTGTFDAFVKIVRYEGITSLWSGLPPTLLMALPATILYFTMYEQLRDKTVSLLKSTSQPFWVPLFAGTCARMVTVTVVSPVELIRTKVQSERIKYSVISKSVSELIRQRGIMTLWHGWMPTLLRDVPFSALYWFMYEQLKLLKPEPTLLYTFMFGAVSGSVAATVTLPFDVVKTYRQVEIGEAAMLNRKNQMNTRAVIIQLYRTRGIKALFTGLTPRLLKIAPSCAIMISSYELGKSYFKKRKLKALED